MRTEILGIGIDVLNRKQALDKALGNIADNERKCKMIITPNPEIIMLARKDNELKGIMEKADMVIPDGVGVVWASKYSEHKLEETVPGCDLCYSLLEFSAEKAFSVYILGAKPGVAEQAKLNMEEKYPGVNICGVHDGYFNTETEQGVIDEINNLRPEVLMAGLGVPRQEKWLNKHKDALNVNIAVGCGGSIDVMAGTVKRAPVFFQKLGLEWFYRLIKQPSRFFRMLELPKFVFAVMAEKSKK